jgi:hypothetical protein
MESAAFLTPSESRVYRKIKFLSLAPSEPPFAILNYS